MRKQWALLLLLLYAVVLLVLSLQSLGRVPNLGTSFDDKIGHFGAYFLFTLLILNYCAALQLKKAWLYALLIASGYGFFMELLQKFLTSTRQFDYYDAVANTCGAVLAVGLVWAYQKLKLK